MTAPPPAHPDRAADHDDSAPLRVLVAGGGVGALETVLALRELAGDRVQTTVLTPAAEYVDRPMTVREPFARGRAAHYKLAALVDDMGAELVPDSLAWVDPDLRQAHTGDGRTLDYDALVLAVGARVQAIPHATTIDDRHLDDLLHGMLQDVEGGYLHSIAFVVPERMAWPLPIYELAMMVAERAYDVSATVDITIVTPESAPLAVFGLGASDGLRDLLAEARIAVITGTVAKVPSSGRVQLGARRPDLEVGSVIALPLLFGPAIRGVPSGPHGFVPVDPYGRVTDTTRVFAVGDSCDYPIKHGGIAAQQAYAAAQVIAQLAGADVTPEPLRAELHAMLMTGGKPLYLSARAARKTGFDSKISEAPGWSPSTKIAARYLAPFLGSHATEVVATA
jgi:sulfide:quinone oxidoreductase